MCEPEKGVSSFDNNCITIRTTNKQKNANVLAMTTNVFGQDARMKGTVGCNSSSVFILSYFVSNFGRASCCILQDI